MQGIIYKGIGGFYYVQAEGELLECRARGVLRNRGQKPLPGDAVVLKNEAGTWYIDEILPRKNALVRPPVANVDQLVIIASTVEPVPSLLVLDTLAAGAIDQEIDPVLVVTKPDLASPNALVEAYRTSGIPVVVAGGTAGTAPYAEGIKRLQALLAGRFSVFCGNSGVGKSTLLNAIAPNLAREVGEISQKLGRGRHTTREVEIFPVGGPGQAQGLVADTPGFASFDLQKTGEILPDNLQLCFPEIKSRIGQCKFSSCVHMDEAGCAVKAAVDAGDIALGRYQSYRTLYQQAKQAQQQY